MVSWIKCGEVLSVVPLIQELENNNIDQILITSSTLALEKYYQILNLKNCSSILSIDVTFIAEKFLNYWKPKACILESEIWPTWLKNKRKKLPLILFLQDYEKIF